MRSFGKFVIPVVWIGLVGAGFGSVWRYESKSGRSSQAGSWPTSSRIELSDHLPTIIVFAHPNCPCTRASLEGLADLVAKGASAKIIVAIVQTPGLDSNPEQSENAVSARKISGAMILIDPNGAEARRFGAQTSGQTIVFSPRGERLFSGGLTTVRGHYGPSDGLDTLSAILHGQAPRLQTTPVFGCSLLGLESPRGAR